MKVLGLMVGRRGRMKRKSVREGSERVRFSGGGRGEVGKDDG